MALSLFTRCFRICLTSIPTGDFGVGAIFLQHILRGWLICSAFFTKEGKRKQGKRKWVGYGNANFLKEFVAMGPTWRGCCSSTVIPNMVTITGNITFPASTALSCTPLEWFAIQSNGNNLPQRAGESSWFFEFFDAKLAVYKIPPFPSMSQVVNAKQHIAIAAFVLAQSRDRQYFM